MNILNTHSYQRNMRKKENNYKRFSPGNKIILQGIPS